MVLQLVTREGEKSTISLTMQNEFGYLQAQACMFLRNLVGRSPELRAPALERGAEAPLRHAKVLFPDTCADVAAAALRDLGFDDYLA